jgi:4-alpha-glucanotransferase
MLERFDAIRLDHFIGFQRYWEIPASEPTAQHGRWVAGPGAGLFEAVRRVHRSLPLIAEDLGAVTPEVTALRDQFNLPGIKLLQFAFGTDPQAPTFLPHNYPRHSVAYTGTHDNDTTRGWFEKLGPDQRRHVLDYLGTSGRQIHWEMIRCVWRSVAVLGLAPAQDLLGLGSEARMNLPGTAQGNWEWRLEPGQLGLGEQERLRDLTRIYGRSAA